MRATKEHGVTLYGLCMEMDLEVSARSPSMHAIQAAALVDEVAGQLWPPQNGVGHRMS